MYGNVTEKLHSRRGISRAVAILLILIAVMLVLISGPAYRAYKYHADELGCAASLKTASDSITIDFLFNGEPIATDDISDILGETMPGRDKLCPAGGTVYLIPLENGTYELVCGLHGKDARQRTRLNASYALERLRDALLELRKQGEPIPETVTVMLNGQELPCVYTTEALNIKRGTKTTEGYEDTVAFFGVAGEPGWEDAVAGKGEVCYFAFADEDYCALWRFNNGWTGDSYEG